jgi:cell division protein FtsI/penicillin-binding protein 2
MKRRRPGEKPEAPCPYGEPLSGEQRRRLRFALACFCVGFLAITIRLHIVHLIPSDKLAGNLIWEAPLTAPRGEIYDRNAALKLATNRKVSSLWFNAAKVVDAERFAASVAPPFGVETQVILDRANERTSAGKPYEFKWVKRWITDEREQTALADLLIEWEGVLSIQEESLRYYPQRQAASHLLGFVNRNGDASEGLELSFDQHLRSESGKYRAHADNKRRPLESRTVEYTPAKQGEAVQLTLDVNIQRLLEEKIDERLRECNSPEGMGVLMDPDTGEILALASRPAFDPNHYDSYAPEDRRNKAVTDYFEPGSAFKIVTAAAAIEERLITENTLIDCENGGFTPYGRHYIRDYHSLGVEPFSKCFEESSNVAIIKVAAMLGPERLERWMQGFGFGVTTSRDFPRGAESPGVLRARKNWNGLSMGALPMGQEVGVTILQLARSFAVVANGGMLVEPHFIERAVAADGTPSYAYEAPTPKRVISESTAALMRELCHKVVLNGTAKGRANIKEYSVGGKTGTAQMLSKSGRGYSKDRYTTVFAGFAPVSDPRVVCVIVIKEPMIRQHWGGYVCGPVFRDVVRDALIRLNVPPDQAFDADAVRVVAEVPEEDNTTDGDTVTERLSEDQILDLELAMESQMESLDGLELTRTTGDVVDGGTLLPDLSGLTKSQAYEALSDLGIPWDPQGAGWVVSQRPAAGTPVSTVRLCALEFSRTKLEQNDDPS